MTAEPAVEETSLAIRIGARLRQMRQERGLTLAALSVQSGVSISYLSAVEKGVNHPSLHTLAAVTEALGASIPAVLAQEGSAAIARAKLPDVAPSAVEISHPQLQLRGYVVAAAPADGGECPVPLGGRNLFLYVIEGTIVVRIDGTEYTLEVGDALDATAPVEVRWQSPDRSVTVWTSCPSR